MLFDETYREFTEDFGFSLMMKQMEALG